MGPHSFTAGVPFNTLGARNPPKQNIDPILTIPSRNTHKAFIHPAMAGWFSAKGDKIILVGLNYQDYAKELNMENPKEPIIFLKPATALIGHQENIVYPKNVERLDYEAELALIIKKQGRSIPQDKANEYISGYTCLNDVTARDLQKRDIQWTRSKSFDTFCPVEPWLETELDTANLKIASYLNGKLKQNSTTRNLIFSIPYLLSFISGIMTLLPRDIISTGTPSGVGPMQPRDTIEVEIEGIDRLTNQVAFV